MAQAPKISDYAARALLRLPQQFKSKPNLADFITATFWSLQDVENVAYDLLVLRWMKNAEGAQLDGIGEIVGEARQGNNDANYLERIYQRIFLNASKGTPETLISVLALITGGTLIIYNEVWPAKVQMITNGSHIPDLLRETMEGAAPAGVGIDEILMTFGETPFVFHAEGGIPHPPSLPGGRGFAELGYSTGGSLSEKVA
jgi:hypothetical protein